MNKSLLALIAGLLWPLAFSPWNYWPLVIISIIFVWWSQTGSTAKQAAWRGLLFGIGFFGFGVNWLHVSIHTYGYTPLWLAIPLTGLFALGMALYPALQFYLTRRLGGHPFTFAGLWVLTDALRGWLLTGFPWLYGGYAMLDTPLANLASIGGIGLLTLMTVITALTLALIIRPQKIHNRHNLRPSMQMAAISLLGWSAAFIWQPTDFTEPAGDAIKVAMVQGNIPQDLKWLTTQQETTRLIYHKLTESVDSDTLVVWPESAITEFYQDVLPFMHHQKRALSDRNSTLITGVPWRIRGQYTYTSEYFNSIVVAGTNNVYHKQKLVPFGEYIPLQDALRGLIPFFDLPMSSFTRGRADQANLNAQGITVAPFICYEILYPDLVASRTHDSHVLLTISNDAWFGESAGPLQHFQMTRLRAMETGRWLMRATNNGVTAIIDPNGHVVDQLPQFKRDILEGTVEPRIGLTPFQRTGSLPVYLLAALITLLGGISSYRTAKQNQSGWTE